MKRAVLALIAAAIAAHPMLAQSSAIVGRVVSDETGEPIRNSRVILGAVGELQQSITLSDQDGHFHLLAPPGRHSVVATKTGFARGSVVAATDGTPAEIRLRRGAAISGRVVDDGGDPVVRALVTVETHGVSSRMVGRATTDDRGEYRIGGLAAGFFTVAVSTVGPILQNVAARSSGGMQVRTTTGRYQTFYPNAFERRGAEAVHVNWGVDRTGIDLVLPADRAGAPPFDVFGPPIAGAMELMTAVQQTQALALGTRLIRGRVRTAEGSPIPYARLVLGGTGVTQRVIAGSDGAFAFRDVPARAFRISASRVGYFTGTATGGARTAGDVAITLAPWGVIAGRVTDEHGDPVQGASVGVLQVRYENGRRTLAPPRAVAALVATDDNGAYRLFGLMPGQYLVSAEVSTLGTAGIPGYARTLFPGTALPSDAQFISIGRFPEVTGVDFAMVRTRTARVTGHYIDAQDQPTGGSLQLLPSYRSLAYVSEAMNARISRDGRFEFANVPPGEYVIQGYRGPISSWTEGPFGAARVTVVGSDVDDVIVRTSPGSFIRGRVVSDPSLGSVPPSATGVVIEPIPIDPDLSPRHNLARANVSPDGTFVIEGINGPRRLQVTRTPPGWVLKEIRVGGIDVTDQILNFGTARESLRDVEVELTDRVSEVLGTTEDRSRPVANVHVVVFPVDRSLWYPRSRFLQKAPTDPAGAFSFAGLPPGSYYAAAVATLPDDGDEAWQDLAFLDSLMPSASTVLVGEGQRVTVNPRLAR